MTALVLWSLLATRTKLTPAGTVHLCAKTEQVLFSCTLQNTQIVSVCASTDLAANAGKLEVRQGPRGHTQARFPEDRAQWWHVFWFHAAASRLAWKDKGNDYELSPRGLQTTADQGDGASGLVACAPPVTNNLAQLAPLLPDGDED